jgi:Predicted membrane protein (DUF2232)
MAELDGPAPDPASILAGDQTAASGSGEAPGRKWGEAASAALLALLMLLLYHGVPFLGALGLPLAGAALGRLAWRRGWAPPLAALVPGLALVALVPIPMVSSPLAVALRIFEVAVLALPAAAILLARRVGTSAAFSGLVAAGLALLLGAIPLINAASGHQIGADASAFLIEVQQAAVSMYRQAGVNARAIRQFVDEFDLIRDVVQRGFFGIVGSLWIFGAAVAYYVGLRPAARSGQAEGFEHYRSPALTAAIFVVAGAGAVFAPVAMRPAFQNGLAVVASLYFLVGLSIICYFARRWLRVWLWRASIYLLAGWTPINAAVALLGVFDWYFDFRKRADEKPGK